MRRNPRQGDGLSRSPSDVSPPTLENMNTAAISTPHPPRGGLTLRLLATPLAILAAIGVAHASGDALASPAPSVSIHPSPFGASAAIEIGRIGRIEVDLQPATTRGLSRVPCIDAAAGSSCFVPATRISIHARKVEAAER